jgi:enoyl-CoA hydratase/carnithine racemase
MDQTSRIVVSVADGVATVRLNEPASMNALTAVMARDLDDIVRELSGN